MNNRFLALLIAVVAMCMASCGDINQVLVIGEDGQATFEMNISPEDRNGFSNLSDFNFIEGTFDDFPTDTTIYITEGDAEGMSKLTAEEKALLEGVGMQFKKGEASASPHGDVRVFFDYASLEERNAMMAAMDKLVDMESKKAEDPTTPSFTEAFNTMMAYEIDPVKGEFKLLEGVLPKGLTGGMDLGAMLAMVPEEEVAAMRASFSGSLINTITLPGKIKSVEIMGGEIISDNTVEITADVFDALVTGAFPGGIIKYESSQEITDPTLTEVWDPEPTVVTPGKKLGDAPSDAISLLGKSDGSQWVHYDGSPNQWKVKKGVMTCKPGTGTIKTKQLFGDCQLHIEWKSPKEPNKSGQDKGNSGIFFQNKYEIQILNSFENRTYSNGQAGAIYKQAAPLVNAMKSDKNWNVYDIIYHAPEFDASGNMTKNPTITAFHNGVLIQDHFEIEGTTEYIGAPKVIPHGDGPLVIQDHNNLVQYRNIWIREL